MGVFQFGTAFSFGKVAPAKDSWRHTPVVLFVYLFCAVYSIGEGPVPLVSRLSFSSRQLLSRQVYASEILPLEVRDTGKMAYPNSKFRMLNYGRGWVTHWYLLGLKLLDGLNLAFNVPHTKPRGEFLLLWRAEPYRLGFGHTVSTTYVTLIS